MDKERLFLHDKPNPLLPFSTILSRETSFSTHSCWSKQELVSNIENDKEGLYDHLNKVKRNKEDDYENGKLMEKPYFHVYRHRSNEFEKKWRDLTPRSLFNEVIINTIEEGKEILQLSYTPVERYVARAIMNHKKRIQYLDELLLEYFSILDDYISTVSQLSTVLKQGHFSIAKTNYLDLNIYGSFKTLHGYNRRMKALYYLNDTETGLSLERRDDVDKVTGTTATQVGRAEGPEIFDDPLNWFGILVPHELRRAQQCFQQGLEEAVRIIQLRHVLDQLVKKIILYRKNMET
ncbi:hypothetical protein PCK2_000333 [Pneumocystis canis]|nr:hypothetical protein PCK2_000333 [Pneumocystis canis]